MLIKREEFLNDLNKVRGGLSPREFIEQSSCFVFDDGYVMTFNDEVACRKKINVNLTGAVQANIFMEVLGKLKDDTLEIQENEKGEVEFKGKRKSFGIIKDAEILLPIDQVETPEKWRTLKPELIEAMTLVQHCVSRDESQFALCCIHLAPEHVEATDNTQVMRVKVHTGFKRSVCVRGTSLESIATLSMTKIALTKSWLHFQDAEGLMFSCRRYQENFPEMDDILDFKGHEIVIPKGMAEASDRAAVFAVDKAGDPLLKVELDKGRMRLTGEGLSGWYKEVKKVAYDGPKLEFLISPHLMRHLSERYNNAQVHNDRLQVRGGSWQYVTVLGAPGVDAEESPETKPGKKDKKKPREDKPEYAPGPHEDDVPF